MRIQDAQQRRGKTRAAKIKPCPPIKNPGGRLHARKAIDGSARSFACFKAQE